MAEGSQLAKTKELAEKACRYEPTPQNLTQSALQRKLGLSKGMPVSNCLSQGTRADDVIVR
jgi:hypothetical protein